MDNDPILALINGSKGKATKVPEVTSFEKEKNKNKKEKKFVNKIFLLSVDEGSDTFSDFMTNLINNKNCELLREESSWTQHGELIKSIDYLETIL